MYPWRAKAQMRPSEAQDDVNPDILGVLEGSFLLDVAHLIVWLLIYNNNPKYWDNLSTYILVLKFEIVHSTIS